jgi:hypothetical protein
VTNTVSVISNELAVPVTGSASVDIVSIPTTTVVTADPTSALVGQTVTFTATVTPGSGSGTPEGTIQWIVDGVSTGAPVTLHGGQAQLMLSWPASGSHTVRGIYSGGGLYLPSNSNTVTEVVNKITTTATVTADISPSVYGQQVIFTVVVSPVAPGTGTPTGTVQWKLDGVSVGSLVTLDGLGKATLTTSTLTAGSHTVRAVYNGTTVYAASNSNLFSQTVSKANTATTLVADHNPSSVGQLVTFTATVTRTSVGSGIPDGQVQWKVDGVLIVTSTLNASGVSTYSASWAAVGSHTVRAIYVGTTNYSTSNSNTINQTIR